MYKSFFGLEEAPFNLTPDPRFLFLSQRHREAIAALMFGVNERKGFTALTGEIGAGKTTICRALMNELTAATKVALILNPSLSEVELLQAINEEYGIPHATESKKELLAELNRFLLQQRALGHTALLIIDESQNLSPAVLETETDKLIQIVLMGQPEFAQTLLLPELEQLNQRITVKYHITPLTEEETAQYIRHRMFIAKAKVDVHLETPALRLIYDHTQGVPRRINVLMDRVLLVAYVEGTYQITEDLVRRAIAEVKGQEGFAGRREARTSAPRPRRARRWVRATLAAAASVGVLVAGVVIALQFINPPGNSSSVLAGRATEPPPPVRSTPMAPSPNLPDGVPVAYTELPDRAMNVTATDSLTEPGAAAAAPEPAGQDWVYDHSNIVRVSGADEAWHAALMTLMSIWSHQRYDLAPMRDADAATRQRVVEAIYNALADHGFRQVRLSGSLASLIRYDIPLILTLGPGDGSLSPHVVLLGAKTVGGREMIALADPVRGLVETDRTALGTVFQGQATALYPDPLGLGDITPATSGAPVAALQRTLTASGHYTGAATGAFDTATREALRDFQRDHKLDPTGEMDAPTALHLALLAEDGEGRVQ
jgi:general secretion pathway protein A